MKDGVMIYACKECHSCKRSHFFEGGFLCMDDSLNIALYGHAKKISDINTIPEWCPKRERK